LRSGPRLDGSFGVLKVSHPPVVTVALSCAGAMAPEIGNNTYLTQSPIPRSGYGSWGCKSAAILGSDASSVDASMERRKSGHETPASADVRYSEARDARQQEQEELSDVVVTGNTVPSVVPSGVRTSNGVTVRVDDSMQVASMEHDDDDSWYCHYNLPPRVCVAGRADLPLAVCAGLHAMTADNGITSQRTAPRQRYAQMHDNGSGQNEVPVVYSQFVDSPVCTRGDGKNDFYAAMMKMMVTQSVHFHGKLPLG